MAAANLMENTVQTGDIGNGASRLFKRTGASVDDAGCATVACRDGSVRGLA
jgi:hypothetical protein